MLPTLFTELCIVVMISAQRKDSLYYGSCAGAEIAATYHSVIGMVQLQGSSIWNFIGTFFKISLIGAESCNLDSRQDHSGYYPMLYSELIY